MPLILLVSSLSRKTALALLWLLSIMSKTIDSVIEVKKEGVLSSSKIAIVALYERKGLEHSLRRLLEALRWNGYDIVVVRNRSELYFDFLTVYSQVWINQENEGFDFGSYSTGLLYLKHKKILDSGHIDKILFINSSVYVTPICSQKMVPFFSKYQGNLGMTRSHEYLEHVQSYWFQVNRRTATSKLFLNYFRMHNARTKQELIHREVVLSLIIGVHQGVDSLFPQKNYLEAVKIEENLLDTPPTCVEPNEQIQKQNEKITICMANHNPSHHFANYLSAHGYPVKLDLWRLFSLNEIRRFLISAGVENEELESAMVAFTPQSYQKGFGGSED